MVVHPESTNKCPVISSNDRVPADTGSFVEILNQRLYIQIDDRIHLGSSKLMNFLIYHLRWF